MSASTPTPPQSDLSRDYNPFVPPQRDNPYPIWARARRETPVFYSEVQKVWVITRYEDICEVVRDPARFSSADAARPDADPPEVQAVLAEGYTYEEMRHLLITDPPAHVRLRKYLNAAFTLHRVAAMEPRTRDIANELVDGFIADGQADMVARFAYPLPLTVIMELLGVPREDRDAVRRWCDCKVALQWGNLPLEEHIAVARGFVEFQRYFEKLIARRREEPQEDFLTALIELRLDERPLNTAELVGNMMALVSAGHETTTNLISHALILLLRERDSWKALRDDPGLATQAIEETLRMDSPVMGMMRTTTQDLKIGGVLIPAGARVQLMYGSANHDETQFPDPDCFSIHRQQTNQHLAFGRGIHFCLGAPLARLEGRIALEVLATRLPNLRLDPNHTIKWVPNAAFRGPKSLILCWDR